MTRTTTLMSAEELLALPDDHMRHELVRGELTTMAPAGEEHGDIGSNLALEIGFFARKRGLGRMYAVDTGFILSRVPDTVRVPDVAFVRTGRLSVDRDRRGYVPLAPDLAVEVVSPTDRRKDILEKIDEYLAAGTTLVWLVQPRRKGVTIYRRDRQPIELKSGDRLDGEDVLPGFSIPVAELFE